MLERLKWLLAAVGVYGLIVAVQLGIAFAIRYVKFNLMTTSLLCLYLLAITALIFWAARKVGLIGQSFAPLRKYLPWIFIGYGVIFCNNIFGSFLISLTGGGTTTNQAAVMEVMSLIPSSAMICWTVLLAPVSEEVLCRGIIPQLMFKGYEKFGYLVGAFLFAYLHGPTNLASWVLYGGMSVVLTFIAYKSRHLEVSIGLHMLMNGISMALMLLLPSLR